jgi:hypothetical protein
VYRLVIAAATDKNAAAIVVQPSPAAYPLGLKKMWASSGIDL